METLTLIWEMTMTYTVEQWHGEDINKELFNFFLESAKSLANAYNNKFNYENFQLFEFAKENRVMLCKKNGRPVGVMLSRLAPSSLDPRVNILAQVLLYGEPGTKAAYLLMEEFIDFGRRNANHIITMINTKTNIKRRSLEKLGFVKTEEHYRLEV